MIPLIIACAVLGILALGAGVALVRVLSQTKESEKRSESLSIRNRQLLRQKAESEEAQEPLRLREEWYRTLFNNTNEMVVLYAIDEDGLPTTFLEVNDLACSRLERTREEMMELGPLDIESAEKLISSSGYSRSDLVVLSDDYIRKTQRRIVTRSARRLVEQIVQRQRHRYEQVFVTKSGGKIPVEVESRSFELMGQTVILASATDVTEQKDTDQELRETRRRFDDVFQNSPIGIALYDGERALVNANPASLKMLGIPDKDELAKLNLFDNVFIPKESRQKLDRGETVRYEAVLDFDRVVKESLFATTRLGTAYLDVLMNNMGVDQEYRHRGYFAEIQDVSDRRRAEEDLKQSEEQLRQAEKMEAIGSMAGGIAHDFNNILTPIVGYTKMILRSCQETDAPHKYAQGIHKAAIRAKDLVGQILTFSRKKDDDDEVVSHPISLSPIVKEVLQLQRTSLPPEVEIKKVMKADKDVVFANPTKIHQVLMNLCTNAGHAMRETGGGTLEVMMTNFVVEPRSKSQHGNLEPGRYVMLSVGDTGSGMDKATMERIFEPFFTTKPKGEGTGMGLSVVHGIIRKMKGNITVDSELGKGTAFKIVVPCLDEKEVEEKVESAVMLPTGTERILIVDDDPDNLEMEKEMLSSLGYQTIIMNKSPEALALVKQDPSQIDIVVTDHVMPELTGAEMSRQILALRPDMPIILCTGYSEKLSPEEAKAMGIREFITKPISMDQLAVAIRRELDRNVVAAPPPGA